MSALNTTAITQAAATMAEFDAITSPLRAELVAARAAANRQNIIAGRVAERLRNERDQLHRTLRAVRCLIDGSQPKDLPGAVMAIDAVLPAN